MSVRPLEQAFGAVSASAKENDGQGGSAAVVVVKVEEDMGVDRTVTFG